VIYFKDTGVGVSEKNISKLFEPFFTTKKKGKGVGLGLSVAYGIIQEHGGSIYVESRAEEGTSFNVKLPLKPDPEKLDAQGGLSEQH
jgi:signal transduction histidine kinase